mmetsp:Transcript_89966/g.268394  ORF Transcript_89966/g.268394 Transcript_89966/m.268394 type:complete len:156 (-) Transcript_89966:165-632(-)
MGRPVVCAMLAIFTLAPCAVGVRQTMDVEATEALRSEITQLRNENAALREENLRYELATLRSENTALRKENGALKKSSVDSPCGYKEEYKYNAYVCVVDWLKGHDCSEEQSNAAKTTCECGIGTYKCVAEDGASRDTDCCKSCPKECTDRCGCPP